MQRVARVSALFGATGASEDVVTLLPAPSKRRLACPIAGLRRFATNRPLEFLIQARAFSVVTRARCSVSRETLTKPARIDGLCFHTSGRRQINRRRDRYFGNNAWVVPQLSHGDGASVR